LVRRWEMMSYILEARAKGGAGREGGCCIYPGAVGLKGG